MEEVKGRIVVAEEKKQFGQRGASERARGPTDGPRGCALEDRRSGQGSVVPSKKHDWSDWVQRCTSQPALAGFTAS